jgi:hemerythrin superfamily protein
MTTPETPKPNTARDLLLIHRIISRALEVARQKGQEYLATGFPDPVVRQGYHDYVHCLVTVLGAHHLTEDEVIFPQLGVRIPSTPCELLSVDHQKMVMHLDDIKASLDHFDEDESKPSIGQILNRLERLKTMWYPHIEIEETHFTEKNVNLAMSDGEQLTFAQQTARYSQEHTSPDYLVIPFLLFNLTATERKVFSANIPPVVTQQLVPQVWKEKWLPMKPFLITE